MTKNFNSSHVVAA